MGPSRATALQRGISRWPSAGRVSGPLSCSINTPYLLMRLFCCGACRWLRRTAWARERCLGGGCASGAEVLCYVIARWRCAHAHIYTLHTRTRVPGDAPSLEPPPHTIRTPPARHPHVAHVPSRALLVHVRRSWASSATYSCICHDACCLCSSAGRIATPRASNHRHTPSARHPHVAHLPSARSLVAGRGRRPEHPADRGVCRGGGRREDLAD